jgi:hypothetical protein
LLLFKDEWESASFGLSGFLDRHHLFMRIFKSCVAYSAVLVGLSQGFEGSLSAQTSAFNFNPNPASASVTIESYWAINGYSSPSNPA